MAKSSKEKIEKEIKIILSELEKNSNKSINEIANKLGFSRQKVWRIVKELENDNTIWGYTAIVDDKKMERKRYFILLKKASLNVTEEKLDIVVNRELIKIAEKRGVKLESTYFFQGLYDGAICVTAENVKQVKYFIDDINKTFGEPFVSEANILEVLLPIQIKGFGNPNIKEFKEYFL